MVNKLWYEWYSEDDHYIIFARSFLQELIDLYCFGSTQYKVPEDITLDNLQRFIEIILKHYQYYHLGLGDLLGLGDAFDTYIGRAFRDEFPDGYPRYLESDRRELVLFVCDGFTQGSSRWEILPEDVPFILECLNAPEEEIINMYDKLDKYFEQFDFIKRCNIEHTKRWKAINQERIEAIKNDQPLPIRPMSIELDMCYKVKAMIKSDHLTGNSDDEKIANRLAGYSHTPKGMSWHHLEDGITMELIETGLHYLTRHTGAAAKLRQKNKNE